MLFFNKFATIYLELTPATSRLGFPSARIPSYNDHLYYQGTRQFIAKFKTKFASFDK